MGTSNARNAKNIYEGRFIVMFTIVSKKRLDFLEKRVLICYKLLSTMKNMLINKNIITEQEFADLISEKELAENLRQSGSKFFKRKTL